MDYYIQLAIFMGIPIMAVLFLVVSLYRYIYAKKKNKVVPNSFSVEEMKRRKGQLCASSVIVGVLVTVVVLFMIMMAMAVAYM